MLHVDPAAAPKAGGADQVLASADSPAWSTRRRRDGRDSTSKWTLPAPSPRCAAIWWSREVTMTAAHRGYIEFGDHLTSRKCSQLTTFGAYISAQRRAPPRRRSAHRR